VGVAPVGTVTGSRGPLITQELLPCSLRLDPSTHRLRPPSVACRLSSNPNQEDPLALQPSARHCSVSPLATGPLRTRRCSNPPPREVWVPPPRPLCQIWKVDRARSARRWSSGTPALARAGELGAWVSDP
jgi:hypothetical protein